LVNADPKSDEIIRPILRGKDIKRYEYDFQNLYLINTHNGYVDENGNTILPINVNDYPAVKEWLDSEEWNTNPQKGNSFKRLSERTDQGITPYNLRSLAYLDNFLRQKIYYREISDAMNAVFVEDYIFITNKSYMMTGKDVNKNLLSFLNSNIFNRIMLQQANLTGGKGPSFFKNMPLPLVIKSEDRITEDVLNRFYDLSPEEISYIEKASNK
ncbi:hypothetical protein LLT1_14380, partial [Lactococcus cremoris subsp. cremoris TIFN1]